MQCLSMSVASYKNDSMSASPAVQHTCAFAAECVESLDVSPQAGHHHSRVSRTNSYQGCLQEYRDAVQYSTVQFSSVQYSTVQYSTVQYSMVSRPWYRSNSRVSRTHSN
jgi:hypothetical protein